MYYRLTLLSLCSQNAMGFAAIFGLRQDTKLKGQEYSWLGSIFYFGYLAMGMIFITYLSSQYLSNLCQREYFRRTCSGTRGALTATPS